MSSVSSNLNNQQPAFLSTLVRDEEIVRKSGHLYKCLGYSNETDGKIFYFVARKRFDTGASVSPSELTQRIKAVQAKTAEIFPAEEYTPEVYFNLFSEAQKDHADRCLETLAKLNLITRFTFTCDVKDLENNLSEKWFSDLFEVYKNAWLPARKYQFAAQEMFSHVIRYLGFTMQNASGRSYMTLPDSETFKERWEALRRINPERNIPPFHIIGSDGIAKDLEFLTALLTNDSLLSNGIEFVHDMLNHILNTAILILLENKEDQSILINNRFRYKYETIKAYEESRKQGLKPNCESYTRLFWNYIPLYLIFGQATLKDMRPYQYKELKSLLTNILQEGLDLINKARSNPDFKDEEINFQYLEASFAFLADEMFSQYKINEIDSFFLDQNRYALIQRSLTSEKVQGFLSKREQFVDHPLDVARIKAIETLWNQILVSEGLPDITGITIKFETLEIDYPIPHIDPNGLPEIALSTLKIPV